MNLRKQGMIFMVVGLVLVLMSIITWTISGPYDLQHLGHFVARQLWGWSFIVMGSLALIGNEILKKLDLKEIKKEG